MINKIYIIFTTNTNIYKLSNKHSIMRKSTFGMLLGILWIFMSCSDDLRSDYTKEDVQSYNYAFSYKTEHNGLSTRSVVEVPKVWAKKSVIKIKFLNGKVATQNKVKEIAATWLENADLKFDYVSASEQADVKIGFQWRGDRVSWSYIGTDCKTVSQSEPSMNLNVFFEDQTEINSESFRAAVLREFGHVLGLGFEHRNPTTELVWNKMRVRNYLRSSGWNDLQIAEALSIYSSSSTNYTQFDPNSIMLLYFPDYLTSNGKGTSLNTTLSEKDKETISSIYKDIELPQSYSLRYTQDGGKIFYSYKGVRIGEYYWINNNFNHEVPRNWGNLEGWENEYPITQARLDKYLPCARLQVSQYQIDINDFKKYYGIYYNRQSVDYMTRNGKMYEDNSKEPSANWQLPSATDYQQLFAMCPFLNPDNKTLHEWDVRIALAPKENKNPLAFNLYDPAGGPYRTYWFMTGDKTDLYDFNLMPGGAKLNGSVGWNNGLDDPHPGVIGDIYHLFYTAGFHTKESNIYLHDYLDTKNSFSYHWYNVRWCRPLTDIELGYKLYVNYSLKDIKKLDLNEQAPQGYSELPKGYLRGFYVQYILGNDNPVYSVSDLFTFGTTDRTI